MKLVFVVDDALLAWHTLFYTYKTFSRDERHYWTLPDFCRKAEELSTEGYSIFHDIDYITHQIDMTNGREYTGPNQNLESIMWNPLAITLSTIKEIQNRAEKAIANRVQESHTTTWLRERALLREKLSELPRKAKAAFNMLEELLSTEEFKVIKGQTKEYAEMWKGMLAEKGPIVHPFMQSLTRLELGGTYVVYLTHPALFNAKYAGNLASIIIGYTSDHTPIAALYHEILHDENLLGATPIGHAIIELATDNTLEMFLSGANKFFKPTRGHPELAKMREQILRSDWPGYLMGSENILSFAARMKEKYGVKPVSPV